jgi:hypothetical protein
MVILRLIKFILIFSFLAVGAVAMTVILAIGAIFFLVLNFLFGRKLPRPQFRVYTSRDFRPPPFDFDRPPIRDVTPKQTERLSSTEV